MKLIEIHGMTVMTNGATDVDLSADIGDGAGTTRLDFTYVTGDPSPLTKLVTRELRRLRRAGKPMVAKTE